MLGRHAAAKARVARRACRVACGSSALCFREMFKRAMMCLLLGVVTTVAVAWGCAVLANPLAHGVILGSFFSSPNQGWWYWIAREPGATVIERSMARSNAMPTDPKGIVPWWSAVREAPAEIETGTRAIWIEDARGWPWVTMVTETRYGTALESPYNPFAGSPGEDLNLELGLPPNPVVASSTVHLPTRPIWLSFVPSAVGWAAVFAAIFYAPSALRCHVRRRRGACPACGYDLRYTPDLLRCPECGTIRLAGTTTAGKFAR